MSRDHEPTVAEATIVSRPATPAGRPAATRGFAERLALFVSGVDRPRAQLLLEGLGGSARARALTFERDARGWDSATRQGRMAAAFGASRHASDRLEALVAAASAPMRLAIFRRLLPWQQALFPALGRQPEPVVTPAMDALATRLIREATR